MQRQRFVGGVAYKASKDVPLIITNSIQLDPEAGVVGDHRSQRDHFVRILAAPQWDSVCDELRAILPWHVRMANLCVTRMEFRTHDIGRDLYIGKTAILRIVGGYMPDTEMEMSFRGLKEALRKDLRGGVLCTVIRGGTVKRGDAVSIL